MDDRDWGFAIGDLGDLLADIEDWMTPPYPQCLVDAGVYDKEDKSGTKKVS